MVDDREGFVGCLVLNVLKRGVSRPIIRSGASWFCCAQPHPIWLQKTRTKTSVVSHVLNICGGSCSSRSMLVVLVLVPHFGDGSGLEVLSDREDGTSEENGSDFEGIVGLCEGLNDGHYRGSIELIRLTVTWRLRRHYIRTLRAISCILALGDQVQWGDLS